MQYISEIVDKVQICKTFNNEEETKLLHFKVNFVNNCYIVLTLEIYDITKCSSTKQMSENHCLF
jgi:hypothetical protein